MQWLVESEVYPSALEVEELVCGVPRQDSIESLQMVVSRLAERSCDAVVLGCTELRLVLSDLSSPPTRTKN